MFSRLYTKQAFQALSVCLVTATTTSGVAFSDGAENPLSKRVVVIGGGTGGIGVTAQLAKEGVKNVTIIEPASSHYYQPAWTLVGAGLKTDKSTRKDMKDVIPSNAVWVKKAAKTIKPDSNSIELEDGTVVDYDYLVISAGLTTKWDSIPGLKKALDDEMAGKDTGVVSIYDYAYSPFVYKHFTGKTRKGRCIFTMPNTPIKCPGAPQKIMWLFEEHAAIEGFRNDVDIEFWVPGGAMFGVPKYAEFLGKEADRRNILRHFKTELVKVDGEHKVASFKDLSSGEVTEEKYDMLHVAPPMGAPVFLKNSPSLVNAAGFVDVHKNTLQSNNHKNVFALGDCTSTPNSKSAAAITSQAPVVVHNLVKTMKSNGKDELDGQYYGYGSCPLVLGKNRALLAEFSYDGKITETFCSKTGVFPYSLLGQNGPIPEKVFLWMKLHFFPFAYWNMFLSGNWFGPKGPFKPDVTKKPTEVSK